MEKIRGYKISDIVFTAHARKQMERRKVKETDTYETLRNPGITLPVFEDNTQEFRRKAGPRTHYVVIDYSVEGLMKVVTTGWSGEP